MHSENCSYMILNAFTAVARLDLGWILVRITCILEVLVWSSRYISYIMSYIHKFQSKARKLRISTISIETQTNIIVLSWLDHDHTAAQ